MLSPGQFLGFRNSHGVLPVLVQEQIVQLHVQVIVMGNVCPCAGNRIELINATFRTADATDHSGKRVRPSNAHIAENDVQRIIYAVRGVNGEQTIHIGLA